MNALGWVGPVPEGVSAIAAARNQRFSEYHTAIKAALSDKAAAFRESRGYQAPYWELVSRAAHLVGDRPID
jgi:hypothetical protein